MVLGQPLLDPFVRAWALQSNDQDRASRLLAATPGQQRAPSQLQIIGWTKGKNKGCIRILYVSTCSFRVIRASGFTELVSVRDNAIFGFAAFRAPSAVRNP